ncbi:hypothetical protein GCM10011375_40490 [Hymenobacter qilianensis]|uniref:Uncharacterized protein n=2 Tax=Hymenobacter qilianensis TaxID=1385715 RepID=A0ACB5PXH4_9BACT|nr:hypothetical protein [Hymenobacter qilianensis]QNP54510.1 hypothetical protein H9L05_22395 [Hymenobacter qilianensis]GGF81436.1 hypothetical protein GCM10011375_40490 [Hymenobacter qilianensis]
MSPVLFVALVLAPAVALIGLLVWRFKSAQKEKKEVFTATSNHKSIKNFHYRPAPSLPTPVASPLTESGALSQLMPEEDFLQKQQKEIQEEVERLEAEEAERRELAEAATQPTTRPAAATTSITNAAIDETKAPGRRPPAANATDSVLDTLNSDIVPATASAAEDEAVPDAVYDNPLGAAAAAPTKNDTNNRAAEVELRKRQRAARQLQSAGQKNILTSLLAEKK